MAFEHDRRYKRLFSHPYFLRKLLESFVKESFIKDMDFTRLKRYDKSFVTAEFKEKESDLIFTIPFKGPFKEQELYIFLLLEFQSTVDKLMPVRFLRYITELYESYGRTNRGKLLPSIFPVLLYSGDDRWTAEKKIEKLVKKNIPGKYIPSFEYYAICINEIPKKSLVKIKNAVSAVFYVENSGPEEFMKEMDILIDLIRGEESSILTEFTLWVNNYLSGIKGMGKMEELQLKIENIMEVKTMFATKMKEYEEKLIEKGIEQDKLETARRMLAMGFSVKEISEVTFLPTEKIEQLK